MNKVKTIIAFLRRNTRKILIAEIILFVAVIILGYSYYIYTSTKPVFNYEETISQATCLESTLYTVFSSFYFSCFVLIKIFPVILALQTLFIIILRAFNWTNFGLTFILVLLYVANLFCCISFLAFGDSNSLLQEGRYEEGVEFQVATPNNPTHTSNIQEEKLEILEDLELDTLALTTQLKQTVTELLLNRNPDLITDSIFGDCLHFYLNPDVEMPDFPLYTPKEVIMEKFDYVFISSELKEGLKNIMDDLWFDVSYSTSEHLPYVTKIKDSLVIHTCLNFRKTEGLTKRYWFVYTDGIWRFCGLNCVG